MIASSEIGNERFSFHKVGSSSGNKIIDYKKRIDFIKFLVGCATLILIISTIVIICGVSKSRGKEYFDSFYSDQSSSFHNFGSSKYECSGYCFCETSSENYDDDDFQKDERRTGSTLLSRGVKYVVIALTSILAVKTAEMHLKENCESEFTVTDCPIFDTIQSEIEECNEIIEREDDGDGQNLVEKEFLSKRNVVPKDQQIDEYFFDGNNMMYMTDCMRRLKPWTYGGRKKIVCLLTEAVGEFQTTESDTEMNLFFDGSPKKVDEKLKELMTKNLEGKKGIKIFIARPEYPTSDDYLVEVIQERNGDGSNLVVVTSDKALIRRLRGKKGKIWIESPRTWLKKCVQKITGKQNIFEKDLNDFCRRICEIE